MCTLSYFPTKQGVIVTSNRDESPTRPIAEVPMVYNESGINICYPKDPVGGGSWFICRQNGNMACLLNGAFEKHNHRPPYRLSRGIILKQTILDKKPDIFLANLELDNIEPFNLVFYNPTASINLFEMRWDGRRKHFRTYDAKIPAIWASASLYTPENISKRQEWFGQFLEKGNIDADTLKDFHRFGGEGNINNDLVMDRSGLVQTVSITQFTSVEGKIFAYYQDLLNAKESTLDFTTGN